MKKRALLLTFSLLGSIVMAQDKSKLYDLIDNYSQREGAFALSLNRNMLDAVDLDFDLEEHMKNVSGDIHEIKLLVFSRTDEAHKLVKKLDAGIAKAGFERQDFELEESDLRFFRIYGNNKGKTFENVQILAHTEDNNVIMLAINGKLKVKNIR